MQDISRQFHALFSYDTPPQSLPPYSNVAYRRQVTKVGIDFRFIDRIFSLKCHGIASYGGYLFPSKCHCRLMLSQQYIGIGDMQKANMVLRKLIHIQKQKLCHFSIYHFERLLCQLPLQFSKLKHFVLRFNVHFNLKLSFITAT